MWIKANIKDDQGVAIEHSAGASTFATAGPSTRTTQLFINSGTILGLDRPGLRSIRRGDAGMEAIDKLYADYGEGAAVAGHGPSRERFQSEGKAYTDRNLPEAG